MIRLSGWPAARPDRHATAMLHDTAECRLVAFTLGGGQVVPVHTSRSSVIVIVLAGGGTFSGAEGELRMAAGDSVRYAPGEPHGMTASTDGLRFLAIITPGPSTGDR